MSTVHRTVFFRGESSVWHQPDRYFNVSANFNNFPQSAESYTTSIPTISEFYPQFLATQIHQQSFRLALNKTRAQRALSSI